MLTNLIDYVKDGDQDDNGFGYHYRGNMTAEFKQDSYNKSFS